MELRDLRTGVSMVASSTPDVYMKNRDQWHRWLEENAASSQGIWLLYDKGANRTLNYDDIVEEALCYGWVDSLTHRHNESQARSAEQAMSPSQALALYGVGRLEARK